MVAPRLGSRAGTNSGLRSIPLRGRLRHADPSSTASPDDQWEGAEGDVYMAFIGSGPLHLSGFLVTAKSSINEVIAHCPVEINHARPRESHRQMRKQLELARSIAENPKLADEMDEVISLGRLVRDGRPIPRWVYALACIPLSYPTNGEFLYATPKCPRLRDALRAYD